VRRIRWAVTTAGRHVPGGRHCLAKAIVAKALFDAHEVPVQLRFGVRRDQDGVLRGHAWLGDDNGLVMDAGEDPVSFVPMANLQEAIDGHG
jgi:Transglutaminase-like superfamily